MLHRSETTSAGAGCRSRSSKGFLLLLKPAPSHYYCGPQPRLQGSSHDEYIQRIPSGKFRICSIILTKVRDIAEDAWGPSSGWTTSQASLLLKKICEGFYSTELARLTASLVISVPFQWTTLCDSVLQFQQRVKSSQSEQNVSAIQQKETRTLVCFKCGAAHYMRNCRILVCRYCSQNHKHADVPKPDRRHFASSAKASTIMFKGITSMPQMPRSFAVRI